ncbi:hypothetical protein [Caulobacter sp. UNC279MFTsu5.1]|uniref:stalk-specific protein StpX n=1 Tax=Caulobacter sp. UNC279MFTsu5.1 TaxID=1502775 RepID=UPI0026F40CA1|nr:hypothetical protein [Caulobacter sp. UNC279MFTsu5.1]
MLHNKVRSAALAGCAVSVLMIAGCGAREPVEAPPAATTEPGYAAAQTPDLMGAPPASEASPADGLLGGPPTAATAPVPVTTTRSTLRTWRRPDGTLVTAMAPIANPKGSPRNAHRTVRHVSRAPVAPARRVHVAATPVAHAAAAPVARPTPVAKPAPKPVAAAPAPAPLKPITAAKPAVAPAKAPIVAPLAPPTVAAKPVPAKPTTKLQTLQAAVAPEATRGATLATAESLAQGKEGQVTLSLPATLGELIKTEAAKLGLTKAARKTSAYADLQGQGYEITPNGRQTAVVKAGEPATFAWQVKPTAEAKGPLKTEFGVALNGTKPAQGFTLGSIAKQVAPIQEAVKEKTQGFMPSLGRYETIDLPGVGKVPGKSLLGGALVLLALLILVAISRNASAARARTERRRKFRTLTDYGRNEMDFEAPKAAEVNYVNPMVAAAGGAVAGAVVTDAVGHHGDHGQAMEHNPFAAPAHEDHGRDDHHVAPTPGPEALAVDHADAPLAAPHDDHGHGHEDHGPVVAEAAPHGDVHAAHKELEPAH